MASDISVVIPTYNGAGRIGNVLASLCNQTLMPDEVVVVIDGSRDQTRQVAEAYSGKLPLRIVEIPNGGRAVARNRGVSASSGSLIVFLDDDMRPFPQFLADHLSHHRQYPGTLLAGAILEDVEIFKTDIQRYRKNLYARKGWWKPGATPFVPMTRETMFLAAANFSVSRKVFDELNGFDESLRDAEDYDLGMRAIDAGLHIYNLKTGAQAFHDDLITCRSYITRQRQYRESKRTLLRLKPALYQGLFKEQTLQISPLKKSLFSLLSHGWLVQLIDSGWLRFLLPESLRYRFYDAVIAGLSDVFPERKF